MDLGPHTLRILLVPGKERMVLKSLPSLADWICCPPIIYAHLPIGSWKSEKTLELETRWNNIDFISTNPQHIRLIACKRSFDRKALILRLQESSGISCESTIQLQIPSVTIKLSFNALEIKTIRIDQNGNWDIVNMISEK